MAIYQMRNPIQQYAWGSTDSIARIQHRANRSGLPEAELWMGSHPRAPSSVRLEDGSWIQLSSLLGEYGRRMIGGFATQLLPPGESRPSLPFMMKILAAEQALSIQTHPDRAQARRGFEREEASGVPFDAPERSYRDRNHKPELLCALTEFFGMRGFRPYPELAGEFSRMLSHPPGEGALDPLIDALQSFVDQPDASRWRDAFSALTLAATRAACRTDLVIWGSRYASDRTTGTADAPDRYWWVGELLRQFPGDPGALAPLYLNVFHLEPFEAVFLDARQLHAYLRGTGIEVLANSDNVLRAGCTSKHIDPTELAAVVETESDVPVVLDGRSAGQRSWRLYRTPAREFELAIGGTDSFDRREESVLHKKGGPAIVLALDGPLVVTADGSREEAAAGHSLLIDHQSQSFTVDRPAGSRAVVAAVAGALEL